MTESKHREEAREIERFRKRNPYRVDWPGHDYAGNSQWFHTLREAREEAAKHEDAEIYKEIH